MDEPANKLRLAWQAFNVVVIVGAIAFAVFYVMPGLLERPDPQVGAAAESQSRIGPASCHVTTRGKSLWLTSRGRNKPFILRNAHSVSVRAVALSNDGKHMASSAGEDVVFWDTESRKRLHTAQGTVKRNDVLVFTGSGERLVAFGETDGKIDVWNTATGELQTTVAVPREALDAAPNAFCLQLPFEDGKPSSPPSLKPVELERVRDRNSRAALLDDGGQGGWILRDNVSGKRVLAYNSGTANPDETEPAKSLSWRPAGRYSAYSWGEAVVIWKLCPRRTAKRVTENGRVFLR